MKKFFNMLFGASMPETAEKEVLTEAQKQSVADWTAGKREIPYVPKECRETTPVIGSFKLF